MTTDSFVNHLANELEAVESKMMELLEASSIKSNQQWHPNIWVRPHDWGETDERQKHLQMEVKEKYVAWLEKFQLLFRYAPEDTKREIKDMDEFVTNWIEKKGVGWSLPVSTIPEAKTMFSERLKAFFDLLTVKVQSSSGEPILIVETSALMDAPDPSEYSEIAGAPKYIFLILPTALEELEKHRMGRDEQKRSLANAVLSRLRGWRRQGNLAEGITVNKGVTVKTVAKEPSFERTLHWLDASVKDDRIVASALEIQITYPSSPVILVTSDFNLQTKAAAAGLPFADAPLSANKDHSGAGTSRN